MFYKLTPLLLLVGLVSGGPVSSEASEAAESASEEPHLHPAAGNKEAFMESLPKHPKDISLPNQAQVRSFDLTFVFFLIFLCVGRILVNPMMVL